MKGHWGNVPLTGVADLTRKRMEALEGLNPAVAWTGPTNAGEAAGLEQAREYQDQIRRIQAEQSPGGTERHKTRSNRLATPLLQRRLRNGAPKTAAKLRKEAVTYQRGLRRTTDEGFASAYFGDTGPIGKLYSAYGKIDADEADQKSKYGTTPAWGKIAKDFDDQRAPRSSSTSPSRQKLSKKLAKTLDDFDLEHNSPERDKENRKKLVRKERGCAARGRAD